MAVSVDWPTRIITVPIVDMTLVGVDEYDLDMDDFRRQLRALEDNEDAMPFLKTHIRVEPFTVAGVTKPQIISIINGYQVVFEDGQYIVNVRGADTDLGDVLVHNQVSVRLFNSFGTVVVGGGATAASNDGFR